MIYLTADSQIKITLKICESAVDIFRKTFTQNEKTSYNSNLHHINLLLQ